MKCVYTSDETDALLAELRQDKTFILSNFFALAVKDYYSKKVKKTNDVGERLDKAVVNLQVAQQNFNEINKEAVEAASQKAQEELSKKKEETEERERWTIYARKTLIRDKLEPDEEIIAKWVEHVIKVGGTNAESIQSYYKKIKGVKDD